MPFIAIYDMAKANLLTDEDFFFSKGAPVPMFANCNTPANFHYHHKVNYIF